MTAAAAHDINAVVNQYDIAIHDGAAVVHAALHADGIAAFCETAGLAEQTLAHARQNTMHSPHLSTGILLLQTSLHNGTATRVQDGKGL